MPDRITIKETSKLYNINLNTLYRYIQKGKIKTIQQMKRGKKVQLIERVEIERFLGFTNKYNGVTMTDNTGNENSDNTIQLDTIKDNIEAMALYRLGKTETEYKFLQERYETVIQENMDLREKLKSLPDMGDMEKKDKEIVELKELHRQELEQVKNEAEQAKQESLTVLQVQITDLQREKETLLLQVEQEKKDIIEECKRQLEEYMNKPFWKKLW